MSDSIVIIPTYNEKENIENIIRAVFNLEKAFDNSDLRPKQRLPNAQQLGETSLMFLVHPTLNEDDLTAVGEVVRRVVLDASC